MKPGTAQQWRLAHDLPAELIVECNFWTDYKAEEFAALYQNLGTSQEVPRGGDAPVAQPQRVAAGGEPQCGGKDSGLDTTPANSIAPAEPSCPKCGSVKLVGLYPVVAGPDGWGTRCKDCGNRWYIEMEEPDGR